VHHLPPVCGSAYRLRRRSAASRSRIPRSGGNGRPRPGGRSPHVGAERPLRQLHEQNRPRRDIKTAGGESGRLPARCGWWLRELSNQDAVEL
jgi:hypothetical protein